MKKNTRRTPQETDKGLDELIRRFNEEMEREGMLLEDADESEDEMTVVIGGLPKPKQPTPKGG